ncbi:MAG: L,D-transpeptidase family protein [Acidobacteriota bacterium]
MTSSHNWLHSRPIPAILLGSVIVAGGLGIVGAGTGNDRPSAAGFPEISSGNYTFSEPLHNAIAAAPEKERAELERFYQAATFAPVWMQGKSLSSLGEEAVLVLNAAGTRGLRPQDYTHGLEFFNIDSAEAAARMDVAVTRNLLRLASDVRFGRLNPGIYATQHDAEDRKAPLAEVLWGIAHDPGGIEVGFEKLDPPFADYKRLVAALGHYQALAVSDPSKLAQVGQIERTMERWRWLPHAFHRSPILVNVPEAQLRALDDSNNVALQMRVVVGQTKTPTPLFTADMTYVIFGPYWNVPSSILLKEIVPDIKKDARYLSKNSYEVVDSAGKVVPAEEEVSGETLAGLQSGKLRVRQVPGGKNALGRVKFMFPNQNDVYLHDTPSQNTFTRIRRDVSHGCIRVQKPQELAEWVLRDEEGWTSEMIAAALKETNSQRANIKESIPVFILYHTVTVDEDGTVHFWPDIYKHDAALAVQMATARR